MGTVAGTLPSCPICSVSSLENSLSQRKSQGTRASLTRRSTSMCIITAMLIETLALHDEQTGGTDRQRAHSARNREDRHALTCNRRHGAYWGLCCARFARSWASGHRLRLDAES